MKISYKGYLVAFAMLLGVYTPAFSADPPTNNSNVVARVGTVSLTEGEMRSEMGQQLYQAEQNLYQTQKSWIDQKAQTILFEQAAKKEGLSVKEWEKREIDDKTPAPSQDQIQQMAGRFARPGVASTDTLKMASDYMLNQNKMSRRNQLYQEMLKTYPVEILVYKPEAPRVNVTYSTDDPVKGNSKAEITIVEFTDFQCPFCQRSQETLHQVEQTYGKDIKLVARQFPLPFHDRAKPAAEAALCAKEQGKFWEYRDKLFAKQQLSDADFTRYSQELHLNESKFQKCMADHRYAARIESDIADGRKFGVSGTPHFFINGVSLVGAQPFSEFQTAIQNAKSQKK